VTPRPPPPRTTPAPRGGRRVQLAAAVANSRHPPGSSPAPPPAFPAGAVRGGIFSTTGATPSPSAPLECLLGSHTAPPGLPPPAHGAPRSPLRPAPPCAPLPRPALIPCAHLLIGDHARLPRPARACSLYPIAPALPRPGDTPAPAALPRILIYRAIPPQTPPPPLFGLCQNKHAAMYDFT
jgi:hypothetical protein